MLLLCGYKHNRASTRKTHTHPFLIIYNVWGGPYDSDILELDMLMILNSTHSSTYFAHCAGFFSAVYSPRPIIP